MKRIKYFLQHIHGIWSVPLIFFVYYMVGVLLAYLFGYGTGAYDPAFIQPLFLAGAVVLGITNFTLLILFFTFKSLYRYLYGRRQGLRLKQDLQVPETGAKQDWLQLTV